MGITITTMATSKVLRPRNSTGARGRPARVALLATLGVLPLTAVAGSWTIDPRLTLGAVYSDNIDLTSTGAKSDLVLTQQPGLSIRGDGRRVDVNLEYNLQNQIYVEGNGTNGITHQLGSRAKAELLRQLLFFNATATVSQQNLNNFGRASRNAIGNTAGRTDVISYSFGPTVQHRFGNFADATFRYVYTDTSSGSDVAGFGGAAQSYDASLASGSAFGRLGWGFSARRQERPSAQGSRDSTFTSYDARVSYRIVRQFTATGGIGFDDNSFQSTRRGKQSGVTWNAGGTWTPSDRTSLSASYGDRPFGRSISMDAKHRANRWNFSGRYSEDYTTVDQIISERSQFVLVDAQGRPVIDPLTNSFVVIDTDIPRLTNDVIVQRRFEASADYTLRRGSLGLRAYRDDRSFEVGGDSQEVLGFGFRVSRPLSPRLTSTFDINWQQGDARGGTLGSSDYQRLDLSPGINYTFGRSVSGSLRYSYQRSDGSGADSDYEENRVTGFLTMAF